MLPIGSRIRWVLNQDTQSRVAYSSASRVISVVIIFITRHPTIIRENTSIMNATKTNHTGRLDPQDLAILADEGDHPFCKQSSCALAKYADAKRRISFALRSCRFSCSSWSIRSLSLSAGAAGVGLCFLHSIFIQRRNDSALKPIIMAMEQISSHCILYSCLCFSSVRTARSRASGEN